MTEALMKIHPHLSFDGQCEAAFRTYQRLLGGEIRTLLTYGESPIANQFPVEMRSKILHATLLIDDQEITGADVPSAGYRAPQGFSVMLSLADRAKAEEIFRGLADGGNVHLALGETFWAKRYGVLVDRFAVPWEINCT
jgi:PhnB protein